jgi:protein O-mannosyl-transferase
MTPRPRRGSARTPVTIRPAPRADLGVAVALTLVTLLVFGRVIAHDFVPWDDGENVYENPGVRLPLGAALADPWRHPVFASYLPVTRSVWALVWHLSHGAGAFHIVNLLLHTINVLLVWRLLRRVGGPAVASAIGAALFALHPLQVEAVAWVTGLKDVLGATFSLVALDAFAQDATAAAGGRGGAPVALAIATAAFVAAMLSKASSVVVPVMAFVTGVAVRAPWRRSAALCGARLTLAVPVVLVTRAAEVAAGRPFTVVALVTRPWIALDALGFYLVRLVTPFDLSLDHGRTPDWVMTHHGSWPVAILPLVVALAIALARSRRWELVVAAVWFVVPLTPVLGLTPFLHQNISTVADRYVYLAMLGPAWALTIAWMSWRAMAPRVLIVVTLAVYATLSVLQLRYWRDGETLFSRVLAVNPRSWIAHNNRGVALGKTGHTATAAAELRAALVLEPGLPEAHSNLGNVLYLLDRPDSAMTEWRTAIRLLPTMATPHRNLGQLLALRGDTAEAVAHLREAMRLTPDDSIAAGALRDLGVAPGPTRAR